MKRRKYKKRRKRTDLDRQAFGQTGPRQRKKLTKKEREERYKMLRPDLDPAIKRWIGVVVLFGLALVSLLAIFGAAGRLGGYLQDGFDLAFGWGSFLFPLILILVGYYSLTSSKRISSIAHYLGVFLLLVSFLGILHIFHLDEGRKAITQGIGGGYVGYGVSYALNQLMGEWASLVVLVILFLISILIIFESWLVKVRNRYEERGGLLGPESFWGRLKYRIFGAGGGGDEEDEVSEEQGEDGESRMEDGDETNLEDEEIRKEKEEGEDDGSGVIASATDIKLKKKKKQRIDLPIDLLAKSHDKAMSGDIEKNKEVIKKTLENFGIDVDMSDVKVGPTVTQYSLRPAEGVKISRIVTLQNDLALALAAHPLRIEAPIPGKSLVGVEVPNEVTATVVLRDLLETSEFKKRESNLTFGLGQDVAGHPWLVQLDRLPHLLIAGATGSGKSVCLNSIIVSLLYQNSSDDLKFILVDPKRVELTAYNNIPHLLTPVIMDVPKVIRALKWTVGEMERRFHVLSEAGKRDIKSYNRDSGIKMPYIVFAIDELADLMTAAGAEVEGLIIRLAQMSRAVGIHLVLATQRPSVDIITGLIKANIPARIAFSVASLTDSRTILDMSGAEKLLGRGDMLYVSADISKPKRLQGAFLSDKEIESVIRYLRERSEPEYNEEIVETTTKPGNFGGASGVDAGDGDELLEDARGVVIQAGKASASLLQRRLRVGYARAARLLDLLESEGVVGPADGAKPREILVAKEGEEGLRGRIGLEGDEDDKEIEKQALRRSSSRSDSRSSTGQENKEIEDVDRDDAEGDVDEEGGEEEEA